MIILARFFFSDVCCSEQDVIYIPATRCGELDEIPNIPATRRGELDEI
jgi:hypothetical protein